MQDEARRVQELADFLEIPARISTRGNELVVECETVHQVAELRLNAIGDSFDPGEHIHSEEFMVADERYQERWVSAAESVLRERSIPHRVEREGNEHHFIFDRYSHVSMFSSLRDAGIFDRAVQECEPSAADYESARAVGDDVLGRPCPEYGETLENVVAQLRIDERAAELANEITGVDLEEARELSRRVQERKGLSADRDPALER